MRQPGPDRANRVEGSEPGEHAVNPLDIEQHAAGGGEQFRDDQCGSGADQDHPGGKHQVPFRRDAMGVDGDPREDAIPGLRHEKEQEHQPREPHGDIRCKKRDFLNSPFFNELQGSSLRHRWLLSPCRADRGIMGGRRRWALFFLPRTHVRGEHALAQADATSASLRRARRR